MLLEGVIGQAQAKELLGRMIRTDRLPHALLLLGPPGSGGLALAWAAARYLLCTQRGEHDACGQCPACQKTGKGIHPDLHFSFPTIGSKMTSDAFLPKWREALAANPYMEVNDWLQRIDAENKQGNITREECVHIVRKLSLKPYESPYKVLLMWLPEYLGNEGNRLLKLIEEPPDQTIFLLVAEDQEQILPTILSRCQLVKVNPLADDEIVAGLQHRLGLGPDEALAAAQLAGGNFNEALSLAAVQENDHARRFLAWMRACYKGRPVEMTRWVEGFAELGRENQKHFLRYALHFWRELLALKFGGGGIKARLRSEELETARRMADIVGLEQLGALIRLLDDCTYHVERNAHPKVLFLDASIRMHHILQNRAAQAA
jgi:DNA polymerase-3 subunit delta'